MKTDEIFVAIVTAIFLVYIIFIAFQIYLNIVLFIFTISPVLVIAMVLGVLRFGKYTGPELAENQEFGYLDKPQLGKSTLVDHEQVTASENHYTTS